MKTYIDLIFNPDSADPAEMLKDMEKIGLTPMFGVHDLVMEWDTEDEFRGKFKQVKEILKNLKISYRLITVEDSMDSKCPFL